MSYIDKARELGEALVQTPEVQALLAAEAAIKADPEANESFMQYQEKERQLVTTQMLSKVVPEKESLALIDLKIRIINKHPLIKTYFQQQQKFERVMAMVNLTITTSIHGMPSADQLPYLMKSKTWRRRFLIPSAEAALLKPWKFPRILSSRLGLNFPRILKSPASTNEVSQLFSPHS